ncbi:MlaD family protein [Hoyosella subflava]|uniref:Virulence factor Mce family protein n=1 Tax=Hoyosella subflava (strain DSM 45089 / JCM 17490 / NBRC 109087 / DQS3-9A1) TaxID=443218 RepID=F6EN12_HOYSD|nr:MlaD family protein [Hoyosella subflava]AEF39329.1 Virulence factor Mce family protein [Hoyosella subflava DQS3-9A1]
MRKAVLVQLALFVAIAIVVVPAGIRYSLGPQANPFGSTIHVVTHFDHARGIGPGTPVTFRGIVSGKVTSVDVADTGGVDVNVALDPGTQIPADSYAIASMLNPAGLSVLEFRADAESDRNLEDGDLVRAPVEMQNVGFTESLAQVRVLIDSLDAGSIGSLAESMSAALANRSDDIGDIVDNAHALAGVLEDHDETFNWFGENGQRTMAALADASDALPGTARSMRVVGEDFTEGGPALDYLLDEGPRVMQRLTRLLDELPSDDAQLTRGLADVFQILGGRDAALLAMADTMPMALEKLTSIGIGDRADFTLVVTQGPVCYYETPRRVVGDLSPREPNLGVYCPPGEHHANRGALTAPRPDGLGLLGYTTPGFQTVGPPIVDDPLLIPTGIEAFRELLEMGTPN